MGRGEPDHVLLAPEERVTGLKREKYRLEHLDEVLKLSDQFHDRLDERSRREIEEWLVKARTSGAREVDLSDVTRLDTWAEGLVLPLLVALSTARGQPVVVRVDPDRLHLFAGLRERLRWSPMVGRIVGRDGRALPGRQA